MSIECCVQCGKRIDTDELEGGYRTNSDATSGYYCNSCGSDNDWYLDGYVWYDKPDNFPVIADLTIDQKLDDPRRG